jgi:hypothetical protein
MRPNDDDIAPPWRPHSLRPAQDETPPLLRAASLALAMVVVAGAMFWLSREDGPPPPRPVERQARAQPPDPQPRHAQRTDAAAPPAMPIAPRMSVDSRTRARRLMTLPALPPSATPLAQARAVLQPRAAAGDGVAACRLAFARERCEGEARAGDIPPDGFCAGVENDPLPRTEDLLQPAEPWLTPRQKVLLAMIRPDGGVARLARPGARAPEGYVYPQYLADHAYDFLLEGFRARDPLALEGLAIVHAPGDPALWNRNGPVLPNPKLFLFYTGILQRLNGEHAIGELARDSIAATRATLDPRDVAEADAKAATEVRLWLQAQSQAAWQAEWQELLHADLRLQDCAR